MKHRNPRRRLGILAAVAILMFSALPTVAAHAALQPVSKISVVNNGGYVFSFQVQWLSGDDGNWHTADWNSGNYPIDQTRTSPPLSEIGVPSDALAVTPYGSAVLGTSGQGHGFVQFDPSSSNVATYSATGTTFVGFDIKLIS
ncbi:hypothetical protein [Actinoplanes siamensis]|uniref:hypothetical protein n=1 Tax=Actinoplanes siamensis TaxID=1223317 RepID=UPI001940BC8A|nr:hypothetical protein [Actinoplanes siamensis]